MYFRNIMDDTEDTENPGNLPALQLPQVPAVGPANHINEVLEADAIRSEVILQRLYMELPKQHSVQALCKLADTSFRHMVTRRHLLNKQYGTANKGKDDGIIDAID